VLVVAPLERRVARVVQRDKIDEARVRARMAAQIEPSSARLNANFIISNDAGIEHLEAQARAVYAALIATPTPN